MLTNYHNRFKTRGKFIYEPTAGCTRRGDQIVDFIRRNVTFPDYFYHFARGGHVAALHDHIQNKLFFKIDIQNFFYSIARNRIQRALASNGLRGAPTYAAWSTVRSPFATGPKYVLPIGFVQSSHLASLVLMQSSVLTALADARSKGILISIYLDDIIGSHSDEGLLTAAYESIQEACIAANFLPNEEKLSPPSDAIIAFNCNIKLGNAEVTAEREAQFYSKFPGLRARASFIEYVHRVSRKNK